PLELIFNFNHAAVWQGLVDVNRLAFHPKILNRVPIRGYNPSPLTGDNRATVPKGLPLNVGKLITELTGKISGKTVKGHGFAGHPDFAAFAIRIVYLHGILMRY